MKRFLFVVIASVLIILMHRAVMAADNHFFSEPGKQTAPAQTTTKPPAGAISSAMASLEAAEEAVVKEWKKLPYATRNAMFVSQMAEAYGGYEKRSSNIFAKGEKLLSYVEPIGYGWEAVGQDTFRFGVTTDFEILGRDGKIIGGQKAFQDVEFRSHYRNRELFLNLTLSINGLEPGDYTIAYTLHDKASQQATRLEQPFSIRAN